MPASVLLVDDERFARTVYADYLRGAGHVVHVAEDAPAAIAQLHQRPFDLLITDIVLPGADGIELLGQAKQLDPDLEALVITALDRVDLAVRAMKSGASDYLVKPVSAEALQTAVDRCLSTRALLAENKQLRAHLQLFETCQRLTATLEHDKLVPMALAAVAAECGVSAAALAELDASGTPQFAGSVGMGEVEADAVLAAVRTGVPPAASGVLAPGDRRLISIPVKDGHALLGAVLVPAEHLTPDRLARAEFVCRQLGLSLRTVGKLRQVEHLAYLDDLTHLYNVRFLDIALDREIHGGRPFTVLFMDLDRFKSVNDQHGHRTGSALLVEVGRVLKSCVRDDDVLVRYGGDEYVAILVGIDSGMALKVAERIRRAIEDHVFLAREGARVRVTGSIGLASYPEHTRDKAEILDLADRAMYRGKRTTRNVVYVATRDLPPVPVR